MPNAAEHVTRASSSAGEGCILLFGMPRSGTTWLGKLFDSHPDTLYRHEPDTWRPLPMPRYPNADKADTYASIMREFVDDLPDMNALRVAGKLPLFQKSYISAPRARLFEASLWLARMGHRFFPEFPVFGHPTGQNHGQRRVVWKSIESLGRLSVLLQTLDDAVGIQILRHPCGYIASILRGRNTQRFSAQHAVAGSDYGIFNATNGTPLGDRYRLTKRYLEGLTPEERLAWIWVLSNEKTLTECADSERFLCVRYEDVCANPVAELNRLFDFVGLELNSQNRAFINASTSESRDSYYSVFKDPKTAASRWRSELDDETITRIMAIVAQSRVGQYYADIPQEAGTNCDG